MGIAFVQKKDGFLIAGPTTSQALQWNNDTTTGNAVIVCVAWKNNVTITSVTDDQGNSYVDCGAGRLARPTDGFLQILGAKNITGGTLPTVTVSFSASATEIDLYLLEYSGADLTNLFDSVSGTGTATSGTSVTTGSFTPTTSQGAVVAFAFTDDTNASAGASHTIRCNPATSGEGVEDRIFNSSLGSVTSSVTLSTAVTKAGIIAAVIRAAAVPVGWAGGGTWMPPGSPGPRDPRGFLIQPVYSYVETPPPPVPTQVPVKPVVAQGRRRRKRTGSVTQLQAKFSEVATRIPPKQVTVVKPSRSKEKLRRLKPKTIVSKAARGSAPPAATPPARPITLVLAKRRKPRRTRTTLASGRRQYPKPPKPQTLVLTSRRKARKARITITTGARRAPVVTAVRPARTSTLVLPKKRKPRRGQVALLAARVVMSPSVAPKKPQTTLFAKKRRKQKTRTTVIAVARRNTVVPTSRRPSRPITAVLAPKRRKKGAQAKTTTAKKQRTPWITGVTRNSAGTPIPNCNVFVFRTSDEALIARGVSNASGIYLLPVQNYTDNLFVVAYRADAPDIFGTTVNWLTGV